jgi:hypothetical protein
MTESLFKKTHIFPDDILIYILGFIKQNGPMLLTYDLKKKKFIDTENLHYTRAKITLQKDGTMLRNMRDQVLTEEMYKLAVQQNAYALLFVRKDLQTEEMCKLAVEQKGLALNFVRKDLQTEEMCKLAVQQNKLALNYVRKDLQTEEICRSWKYW